MHSQHGKAVWREHRNLGSSESDWKQKNVRFQSPGRADISTAHRGCSGSHQWRTSPLDAVMVVITRGAQGLLLVLPHLRVVSSMQELFGELWGARRLDPCQSDCDHAGDMVTYLSSDITNPEKRFYPETECVWRHNLCKIVAHKLSLPMGWETTATRDKQWQLSMHRTGP